MSKPFFYRLNVADFAVAVMEIPEGGHREWLHQLVRDLASGNGTMPFSQKMIEEVANYRKIQAEHGSRGGKPKHKRPYSDPIGTLSDPIGTPYQALASSSSSTEAVTKEEDKTPLSGKPDHPAIPYESIIETMNRILGTKYQDIETNRDMIRKLWKLGFREPDFKKVVETMHLKWGNDLDMRQYLRPATLFQPKKFEGYLNITKGGRRDGFEADFFSKD